MRLSEKIALRSAICGVVTCIVLNIVSNQMERRALDALLRQESVTHSEGTMQLLMIGAGLGVAYLLSLRELRQLYQNESRRSLVLGMAITIGSFILGFLAVGIMLPAH